MSGISGILGFTRSFEIGFLMQKNSLTLEQCSRDGVFFSLQGLVRETARKTLAWLDSGYLAIIFEQVKIGGFLNSRKEEVKRNDS